MHKPKMYFDTQTYLKCTVDLGDAYRPIEVTFENESMFFIIQDLLRESKIVPVRVVYSKDIQMSNG